MHHSDADSQYTSFRFTAHLTEAGTDASVGSVGDVLDNAPMESATGLHDRADQSPGSLARRGRR